MLTHNFYLSVPNEGGVFVGAVASEEFKAGVSFYEFEFCDDPNYAFFELASEARGRALKNIDKYIEPVCEIENYSKKKTGFVKEIKIIEKGKAKKLPNGNWKFETKSKIEFVNEDDDHKIEELKPQSHQTVNEFEREETQQCITNAQFAEPEAKQFESALPETQPPSDDVREQIASEQKDACIDILEACRESKLAEVSAFSGESRCANQNNVQVDTDRSCEIDTAQSHIKEMPVHSGGHSGYRVELSINMAETIPDNVVAFWYFVRARSCSNQKSLWVDRDEIAIARDIHKISIEAYQKNNEIHFAEVAKDEDAFYVTVFTIYEVNGKEVISLPHKQRFDRPLKANILWKVSKPRFIGSWRLSIEITPNRPLTRLPKLVLCASLQGQRLLYYTDANAEILMEIQEPEFTVPQISVTKDYEINPTMMSRLNKNSRLFLFANNSESLVANEDYSLCWAKGFTGKV